VHFLVPHKDEVRGAYAYQLAHHVARVGGEGRAVPVPEWRANAPLADWIARTGDPRAALERLARRAKPVRLPHDDGPGRAQDDDPDGLVVVNLSTVEARPVRWLWPGRLPSGKLSLVIGDGGIGKTMLLDVAARVSTGARWPDDSEAPAGDVLLFMIEDAADDTIKPRLVAMEADVSRVDVVWEVRRGGRAQVFSLRADLPFLRAYIEAKRPAVIVIDPVLAFLGGADSYTDAEVRAVLAPLAKLAEEYQVTIIGVMHLNKDGKKSALHRIGGSVAFGAVARAVHAVVPDPAAPDERRFFGHVKMNLARKPDVLAFTIKEVEQGIAMAWEPQAATGVDVKALLRAQAEGPSGDAEEGMLETAIDLLRSALAEGRQPSDAVKAAAKAKGISWKMLTAAREVLGVVCRPEGRHDGGRGVSKWYWSLPAQPPTGKVNVNPAQNPQAGRALGFTDLPLVESGGGAEYEETVS
jgi:putative DNA primase/helicase